MMKSHLVFTSLVFFLFATAIENVSADVIGYWRFEEGTSGNTASGIASVLDSAIAGNHGTPFGNPTYGADVPVTSLPGNGLSNSVSLGFDGAGDTVLIGTDAALDSAGPVTIEFWMRSSDTSGGLKLLVDKSHGFVDQTGWFFQASNGFVGFGMGNGGFPSISSTNNIFDDEWHHLAATYDGNAMEFFVDGDSQGTSVIGNYLSNNRDIRIGSASNNGRFFNGSIDELRISDRVLSRSEFLSVPEPSSALAIGLASVLFVLRRKRNH